MGRHHQDSRHDVRKHVLHDVFRRLRRLVEREAPHLFGAGGCTYYLIRILAIIPLSS
jgi:hypothetical protein